MVRLTALLLGLLLLIATPVQAEHLVSAVSRGQVAVTSSFTGETLTLFGSIEPDTGTQFKPQGPYQIIITVTGPLQNRVARRMSNTFGIWTNTRQVSFKDFPSYYHVLASGRLDDITDAVTLAQYDIPLDRQARFSAEAGWWDSVAFGSELVRLMTNKDYFGLNEQGVTFHSETFYSAQVTVPSDIPSGPFIAHTYLFKDGKLIADHTDGFSVRKIGFERFLAIAAQQWPLLYGLVAVILALFTGWLGGVVFKR